MNFVFINEKGYFCVHSFIASFISQKTKFVRNGFSHYFFIVINVFGFVGKNVKFLILNFQKIKRLFMVEKIFSYIFLLFRGSFYHVVKMRRILKLSV